MIKHRNNCGVYEFLNLVDGTRYIGSTRYLDERVDNHWSALERGVHIVPELQADFNRLGPNNFIFTVLECVNDPKKLFIREQFYIDKYGLDSLYNTRNAFTPYEIKPLGRAIVTPPPFTRRKKWFKNEKDLARLLRQKFEPEGCWGTFLNVLQFSIEGGVINQIFEIPNEIHKICRQHNTSYKNRYTPKMYDNSWWAYLNFVLPCFDCGRILESPEIGSKDFQCIGCGNVDLYIINSLFNLEKYKLNLKENI